MARVGVTSTTDILNIDVKEQRIDDEYLPPPTCGRCDAQLTPRFVEKGNASVEVPGQWEPHTTDDCFIVVSQRLRLIEQTLFGIK